MSKRSRSDVSNTAVRIFLQEIGESYDRARGFERFSPTKKQKEALLNHFAFQCCYCGLEISIKSFSQDHLVAHNKTSLGLNSWGNVVPCCSGCNSEKGSSPWIEFIAGKCNSKSILDKRTRKINDFVKLKKYDPDLGLLKEYADNLYTDVGAVAMTLIQLRIKQAEAEIGKLHKIGE